MSFFNIPLELPTADLHDQFFKYGKIKSSFKLKKKRILGRVIEIGTRVVQFEELTEHIPIYLSMYERKIRVIYTGQPKREAKQKKQIEKTTTTQPKNTTQP